MVSITADDLRTPTSRAVLTATVQVRFTAGQDELLRDLAAEVDRPLSALIRDVVTVWALQHRGHDDELTGEQTVDVAAMVAELQALERET